MIQLHRAEDRVGDTVAVPTTAVIDRIQPAAGPLATGRTDNVGVVARAT